MPPKVEKLGPLNFILKRFVVKLLLLAIKWLPLSWINRKNELKMLKLDPKTKKFDFSMSRNFSQWCSGKRFWAKQTFFRLRKS